MAQVQINLRVDSQLKAEAYKVIQELGSTPSALFRDVLAYIVRERKLPVKKRVLSAEDEQLLAIARERLANPDFTDVMSDLTPLRRRIHRRSK